MAYRWVFYPLSVTDIAKKGPLFYTLLVRDYWSVFIELISKLVRCLAELTAELYKDLLLALEKVS
jgi:hypothetical protein